MKIQNYRRTYIDGTPQTPVVEQTNTYDKFNQLITTVTSTGYTVINVYNGDGYRVKKTVNNVLTNYLYEYDKVVLETNANGDQTGRNIYGINLISRKVGADVLYYIYNGHADVVGLLDNTGVVVASYYYDAFGNITSQTGTADNNIMYAGYQYDPQTGLYYLNARMYDPITARFLQEDTYTGKYNDPLSLNLYAYCHNEPLMYYDPTGHEWAVITHNKNLYEAIDYCNAATGTSTHYLQDYNNRLSSMTKKLDVIQNVLDVVGLVPWIGPIADVANIGISMTRGDYKRARSTLIGIMPGVDILSKSSKIFSKGLKIADKISDSKKALTSIAKTIGNQKVNKVGNNLEEAFADINRVSDLAIKPEKSINKIVDKKLGIGAVKELAAAKNGLKLPSKLYGESVDDVIAGAGEVVPQRPTFKVSKEQYPNHSRMLENAQAKGHSLEELEKGSGTRAAQRNRYNAQKEIRKQQGPPPEGFDYDEFPYASTKQGGAGAHVEPVPSAENQAVGRDLGQFYRKHGLKENDPYNIEITR